MQQKKKKKAKLKNLQSITKLYLLMNATRLKIVKKWFNDVMPAYLLIKKILLLSFNDNLEMF